MGKKHKKLTKVTDNEDNIQAMSAPTKEEIIPFINPVRKRKDERKEKRQLKKAKRLAFSQRKEMPTISRQEAERRAAAAVEKKQAKRREKRARVIKRKIEARKQKKEDMQEKKLELQAQKLAIAKEEREMRDLEKKLKMKKSRTSLPQSFVNDGLDYLFEALDSFGKDSVADLDSGQGSGSELGDLDEDIPSGSEDEESDENDLIDDSDMDDDDDDVNGDDGKNIEVVMNENEPKPKSILKEKNLRQGQHEARTLKWQGSDSEDSDSSEEDGGHNIQSSKRKKDEESDSGDEQTEVSKTSKRKRQKVDNMKGKEVLKKQNNDKEKSEVHTRTSKKTDKVNFEDNESESGGCDSDDDSDDDDDDDDEEDDTGVDDSEGDDDVDEDNDVDNDSEGDEDSDDDKNDDKNGDEDAATLREDIYGRTIDKDGNVVKSSVSGSYIPPAKRAMLEGNSGKRKLMLERIKKQLKGLINRASEANMQPISSQIEDIYMSNSRADVNELLTGLLLEACIAPVLTPERLCLELAMLVAILHGNVGIEVGACFLQRVVQEFDARFKVSGHSESKEMDNIVVLLACLYNFKILQSSLLFDVARRFIKRFQEKDIELLLLLLKNAGFSLRKDDPAGLKDLILEIQTAAGSPDASQDKSRIRFMLDILLAIKNNNMRKIPNYDPEHLEHLRKLVRNYIKDGGLGSNQLNIGLEDLLKAEEKGRWWVVGSAWSGREMERTTQSSTSTFSVSNVMNEASSQLMELARKQRMNTDIRKTIFCVIMTSEDFIDAFEKLLKLGLKHQQEREIIHVILDCCLQERKYNAFYAFLAQKFCEFDRRFQMTVQFNLWDRYKEMGSLSQHNRDNLASLISHLLLKKGLSLSVLKVVEFGTLEKPMVRFLKSLLMSLLTAADQDEMVAVFQRIAPLHKLIHVQEGLKLFMQHFLLRGKGKVEIEDLEELQRRIKLAEKTLSLGQSSMLL
ncbi:nucleolar MIF4G domain-containing protein 1-like isoform X2 [Haliotis rubra]|uniref:nucleolar MIF4G domain-containing protein 1-like isoform X2 n=1 Tax=Haliotis rubra TaxID=36100 RepID=UPI001EE5A316|nr:nucleolar MIF4G domain-containing protein 1-like isoform X2 [Haliotis rubra]